MPHIFVSYAKKDTRIFAISLHATLSAVPGLTVWMDASLETGQSWARQIQREINKADFVLVLLSPDVNREETPDQPQSFVLNEIHYSQQEHKVIILAMAQKTRVPVELAGTQYLDLTRDADGGIERLTEEICRRAKVESPNQRRLREEAEREAAEEETRRAQEQEATTRKAQEEETRRKAAEEDTRRAQEQEEIQRKAEATRKAQEDEERRRAEEAAAQQAREEEARRSLETQLESVRDHEEMRTAEEGLSQVEAILTQPPVERETPNIRPPQPSTPPKIERSPAAYGKGYTPAAAAPKQRSLATYAIGAVGALVVLVLVLSRLAGSPQATPTPDDSTQVPTATVPPTQGLSPSVTELPTLFLSPTDAASSNPTPSGTYITANQGINVRSGPSTLFNPPIGSIAAGQTSELLAKSPDGSWFKIKYYSGTGWVFAGLVTVTGDTSTVLVDAGPTPPTLTPVPATPTSSPVPPTPLPTVILPGFISITDSADWKPVEQNFDGVMMVLVPSGCFDMGSNDGSEDEKPVNKQCFDTPFWIDKYEVTQAQFAAFGGLKEAPNAFQGYNRPVERIFWFEARAFCELRGTRLPNEREWEYAARGPDNLTYPWGNTPAQGKSGNQTYDVGSYPEGMSWVGAMDLYSNVLEWVSTLYGIDNGNNNYSQTGEKKFTYPYIGNDGREDSSRMNSPFTF